MPVELPEQRTSSQRDYERSLPRIPRMGDCYPLAPMIYPQAVHRIAGLLDALNGMEEEDPAHQEGSYIVNLDFVPIWSQDALNARDRVRTIVGWAYAESEGWVFVPFVPQIETPDLAPAARPAREGTAVVERQLKVDSVGAILRVESTGYSVRLTGGHSVMELRPAEAKELAAALLAAADESS